MNIEDTLAPNSDQLDSVELTSPRIFQIESVTKGNAEQPVQVHLVGFPRPWRPGKSMRRVLAHCWTTDASTWAGRSLELFCDPNVVFGGKAVGGTRIKRMSHIDGQKKIPLLVTRGKSEIYRVDPLPDAAPAPAPPSEADIAACTDLRQLWDWLQVSPPDVQALILARKTTLDGDAGAGADA